LQAAEPVEANSGQHRTHQQRRDGRLVRDAAPKEAQQEHQTGGVDEEQHALQLWHQCAHHRREPLVRRKLRRGRHPHTDEQHDEERPAGLAPHLARRDIRYDAFSLWIHQRQRHRQIHDGRQRNRAKLDLPRRVDGLRQQRSEHTADHETAWPPGMQHVQFARFLF
jgi:hypothetical protein